MGGRIYFTHFKKNVDPSSPSNYRGITITSAIGKLFNNILNIRLDNFFIKRTD
jgi:hypothetical protein